MTVRINPRLALSLDLRQDGAGSSRGRGGNGLPPAPPRGPRRRISGGFIAVTLMWVAVAAWAGAAAGGNWVGFGGVCLTCLVVTSAILLRAEARDKEMQTQVDRLWALLQEMGPR